SLFRRKLRYSNNELLGSTGPLGTFAAQILLAHALDWISYDVWSDLDTVRTIRNDFAHSFDHELSFSDQSVSDRCRNLRTAEAYIEGFAVAAVALERNFSSQIIYALKAKLEPPRW